MGREKIIPLLQSGLGIDETARKAGVTAREIISVQSFYSEFAGLQDGEIEEALSYQGSVSDMFAPADYDRIGKLCEKPDEIMNSIKGAGIKGRGGGGFPVASKWQLTKNATGENKYIVCNGSEGEGHTCKDLALMHRAPHAIIQGMMLCAAVVGAKKGYIHVRSEYHEAARRLEKAVGEAKGKLGAFEIEVFRGGGSYVCGEETALLRMLQGYRGEPALRPPYPGEKGIYACPTVVNNVESFAAVSCYVLTGKIQKLYTVTGCVDRPGVYEFSEDITVRQLAEAAGMCGAVGFQLGGGTTGRIYSIKDMDLPAAVGTGSVYFLDKKVDVRTLSADCVGFLAGQSCGKCVPCRWGSHELERLLRGNGSREEIQTVCNYLRSSSRCGHGQSIPNVVESAMAAFPKIF